MTNRRVVIGRATIDFHFRKLRNGLSPSSERHRILIPAYDGSNPSGPVRREKDMLIICVIIFGLMVLLLDISLGKPWINKISKFFRKRSK